MDIESLDHGRIRAAPGWAALLRAGQLDDFERVMSQKGGRLFRDFPGRQTVRIELPTGTGGTVGVFLKRYEATYLSLWGRLKRRVHWPGAEDEALREWEAIPRVRAPGIMTAAPVAVGQEKLGGIVTRSFVMTEEIRGAVEGHLFVKNLGWKDRRRLFRRLGELTRRLHGAGLIHKDLYLGHVLIVPRVDSPELFLIDLQRVAEPCCFRERWRVKDLGAMAYSSLRAGATRADLMEFYKAYRGSEELGVAAKRLSLRVVRRVEWLATRRPKHDGEYKPGLGRS